MVQRVATPGEGAIMALNNPNYTISENYWFDGLVTRGAMIGGRSMIGNIDCRISNIHNYRQIELEAKFIKNGQVHVKTGQLLDKKVELYNNEKLIQHLVAYDDHTKVHPDDPVYVMDLRETLQESYFGHDGRYFLLSLFVPTTRQTYNVQVNNWLDGTINDFDLDSIRQTPRLPDLIRHIFY